MIVVLGVQEGTEFIQTQFQVSSFISQFETSLIAGQHFSIVFAFLGLSLQKSVSGFFVLFPRHKSILVLIILFHLFLGVFSDESVLSELHPYHEFLLSNKTIGSHLSIDFVKQLAQLFLALFRREFVVILRYILTEERLVIVICIVFVSRCVILLR